MARPGGSPRTVQQWLKSLHLEQFVHDFLFSGYTDLYQCCHITEADLVRLGITQVGYQKRILSRLPTEAGLAVMELTGQLNNGDVPPSQPTPPPRRPTQPSVPSKSKPNIDNPDYVEIKPDGKHLGRSASCPLTLDRSKSDGELLSKKTELFGKRDLGPRPQKPSVKPRTKPSVFVRRDPPPPLPERVKPVPQPRTPHAPPSLPEVQETSEREENSVESPQGNIPVENLTSSPTNPFSTVDEEEEELVPVSVQNPFNPFNLMERPVPLPPGPVNAGLPNENIPEEHGTQINGRAESPSKGVDLKTRPLPPPPFPSAPPSIPPPMLPPMAPQMPPKLDTPIETPLDTSLDSLMDYSVPLAVPSLLDSAIDSAAPSMSEPLIPPPINPSKDVPMSPSSEPVLPSSIAPLIPAPTDPLIAPPLPLVPLPTDPFQRPVPLPPDPSDAALMITPLDNATSLLEDESPPPPLPSKTGKNSHPKLEPSERLSNMRDPPPLPSTKNQFESPPVPPRPFPTSNISLSNSQEMLSGNEDKATSNVNIHEELLQTDEVNGNVAKEEEPNGGYDFESFLIDSPDIPDNKSPSLDSSRKSEHSCRSSQDDALMGSDHSDLPFPELSINHGSTMSSIASTESGKILGILDGYSSPDNPASSQGSGPSMDASMIQDASDDQAVLAEDPYGQIWTDPPVVNIHKNPPPLTNLSDEACYLPLGQCTTGQPRPPSTYDMPDHPPPPPPIPSDPQFDDSMYSSIDNAPPSVASYDSPPLVPARRAPAPPPGRNVSTEVKASSTEGAHLGEDHMDDFESGYDFLEPAPMLNQPRSTIPQDAQDDVPVIDFYEIRSDEESDSEDFTITLPDKSSDSETSSVGGTEDVLNKRGSRVYTSIKNKPHQRHVPGDVKRRLSMRLSSSHSRGLILNKLEKSGYLWKCGAGKQGKGGFRKRWFVFNGKELRYYENERTMANCKGIIPVGSMYDVKHLEKSSIGDKKTRIELHTNARIYYLATDNCDEGTIWANMLMQAIIAFQPPPGGYPKGGDMSCPDKQGYLKMEGCNQKRFLAIKGEMLCYYSSEKDFEAAIPVSDIEMKLANARVNSQKPEKIILTTPSTTFNITAETAEEAKSWVDAMMEAVQEGLSDKLYLHKVWENVDNRLCADCNMPDPDWCSLNFGIVVCKKCSGIHRQLGVHVSKVRSLKMDVKAFTDTALEVFSLVGNKISNDFWEKELEYDLRIKPMPDDSIEQRKLYIVRKYVDRQFCEQILWERSNLDKELLKAVQSGNLIDCLRLIFSGANVGAENDEGHLAKDLSYGHETSPVIKELLEQNKDYSSHQRDIMANGGPPATLFDPLPPSPMAPLSTQDLPLNPPVAQPRRNTNPPSSFPSPSKGRAGGNSPVPALSQGSPKLPHRAAPLPPSPKSKEMFVSSVGSINEQIRKAGYLFKTGSNRKDFQRRYCILEHGTFSYYQDEKTYFSFLDAGFRSAQAAKNIIEGTDMVYVAIFNQKGHEFCFEIGTTMGRLFLFEAEDEADRRNWMSSLVKFHTPECMWNEIADLEYAGFLRKKIGRASTQWYRLWFLLKGKSLSFYSTEKDSMEIIDLRKAKQISQDSEETSFEQIKDIAIVVPGRTIYLRADTQQISDAWMAALQKNASQIGPELEDQLLTEANVPHIVEECVNFVYLNLGLEQEGVYRLSGKSLKITQIYEMFKANPGTAHIDRNEYEVNDVTSALKKYLRELPDPILTKQWYSKWIEVSVYTDHNVKLQWYKYILEELPKVHYHTLKFIIAHVKRVVENERINKMTDKNISSLFGPTLMALPDSSYGNAEKEISVIGDLMTYYQWLFGVTDEEWKEEEEGVQKLIKIGLLFNSSHNKPQHPSSSLVMPFYIRNKSEGNGITAPVSQTATVKEVIDGILEKHKLPSLDGKEWGLFEVIENGELERMMFNYEVVQAEVTSWDQESAASNYLCIKQNSLMQEIETYLKTITSSATIKYAEGGSRKFKDCYFEISGSTMRYSKGNKGATSIHHWDIVPLKIYQGICPKLKKTAPSRYGITFLAPGDKEYKCLCFESEAVRTMWLACLFRCKLASAAAYNCHLLTEPRRTPMQQLEGGSSMRERTSSFGVLKDNLKISFPWKRHGSQHDIV